MSKVIATFPVEMFHADELGLGLRKEIDVTVYDTGMFEINLPQYLADFDNPFSINDCIAPELAKVIEKYEALCDKYMRWRLSFNNEVKLFVEVFSPSPDPETHSVGMAFYPVYFSTATSGEIPTAVEKLGDGKVGDLVKLENGRIVDDTPEIRAKLASMCAGIDTAESILGDFMLTDDPGAYLLAISHTAEVNVSDLTPDTRTELQRLLDRKAELDKQILALDDEL